MPSPDLPQGPQSPRSLGGNGGPSLPSGVPPSPPTTPRVKGPFGATGQGPAHSFLPLCRWLWNFWCTTRRVVKKLPRNRRRNGKPHMSTCGSQREQGPGRAELARSLLPPSLAHLPLLALGVPGQVKQRQCVKKLPELRGQIFPPWTWSLLKPRARAGDRDMGVCKLPVRRRGKAAGR